MRCVLLEAEGGTEVIFTLLDPDVGGFKLYD
jgi:hypothetical protein